MTPEADIRLGMTPEVDIRLSMTPGVDIRLSMTPGAGGPHEPIFIVHALFPESNRLWCSTGSVGRLKTCSIERRVRKSAASLPHA